MQFVHSSFLLLIPTCRLSIYTVAALTTGVIFFFLPFVLKPGRSWNPYSATLFSQSLRAYISLKFSPPFTIMDHADYYRTDKSHVCAPIYCYTQDNLVSCPGPDEWGEIPCISGVKNECGSASMQSPINLQSVSYDCVQTVTSRDDNNAADTGDWQGMSFNVSTVETLCKRWAEKILISRCKSILILSSFPFLSREAVPSLTCHPPLSPHGLHRLRTHLHHTAALSHP